MKTHLKRFLVALLLTAMFIPAFSGIAKSEAAASVGKSKITSIKLNDNDKPVLKWKTVSNATGYRLYRKADDAKKWTKVTTTKKTTFTDKKLSDSTGEVKYRVRAYTVNSKGKKVWGKYSAVKTVKIVSSAKDETVNDRTDDNSGNGDNKVDESEDSPYPSDEEVRATILALKKDYPEGMHWTNDDSYVWGKDVAKSFGYSKFTGWGCQAFAMIASDAVYGNIPAYKYTDKSRIRVGDILRIKDDKHTVIVLSIDGKKITVAEGNFNSSIHWGRVLDLDTCGFVYAWTRVPLD